MTGAGRAGMPNTGDSADGRERSSSFSKPARESSAPESENKHILYIYTSKLRDWYFFQFNSLFIFY